MDAKVQQAIELSEQGLTRQMIADRLYTSPDKKNRLGGLRKLMARHGFIWDVSSGTYESKQEQAKASSNKPKQAKANNGGTSDEAFIRESELTASTENDSKVEQQAKTMRNQQQEPVTLTQEEIISLKKLAKFVQNDYEGLQEALRGVQTTFTAQSQPEAPTTEFTAFESVLLGTTLQLHKEVWSTLDEFCKKKKFTKKTVVNEAIWDFLKKWGAVETEQK